MCHSGLRQREAGADDEGRRFGDAGGGRSHHHQRRLALGGNRRGGQGQRCQAKFDDGVQARGAASPASGFVMMDHG